MSEPIDIVQQIYEAFTSGDLDAVMERCWPDATITQDPALPWGGNYVGRDGLAEFGLKLVGTIDSKVTTEGMFQAGDHVIQHGRTRGTVRHNGEAFDVAECHVWTVRDGMISAAEFYIDSNAMLAALEA